MQTPPLFLDAVMQTPRIFLDAVEGVISRLPECDAGTTALPGRSADNGRCVGSRQQCPSNGADADATVRPGCDACGCDADATVLALATMW